MEGKTRPTLESTLKSADTEEPIDIYFYRPIGYYWALLFMRLGITPNAVTIASIFLGVGAGACFYFNDLRITVVGIFLLVWANSYDSADGQLARMTKNFSPLGRMLDGFAGNLWFVSIYFAICLRLTPVWGISIWILAAITGFFHSRQASMADYYRNIHLLFVKGKQGSELSTVEALRKQAEGLTWKDNFLDKLASSFYIGYTKAQESWSPNFQELRKLLEHKYRDSDFPRNLKDDFRQSSLPLMKWTNILSFNTRAIALFVALLLKEPWAYFVFELTVLNTILIYMVKKHESICKKFIQAIKSGQYD